MTQPLYDRLKAVMKPEDMAHHYSDLYVRYTPAAAKVIDDYRKENNLMSGWGLCTFFTNQVEGGRWIDLPFFYYPYFTERDHGTQS
jgi:hypothetical protein